MPRAAALAVGNFVFFKLVVLHNVRVEAAEVDRELRVGGEVSSTFPKYRDFEYFGHNMHKHQKGPLKIILQIWPKMLKNTAGGNPPPLFRIAPPAGRQVGWSQL